MTNLERVGQKVTAALLVTQSLFSASMIMVFTISSIIAVELAGDNNLWSDVPLFIIMVGAAGIAYPIGRLMDRAGRRLGLSVGQVLGIVGALIAGWSVVQASLWLFLAGVLFIGMSKGVSDLGRYAAGEANVASKRARAISIVVLGGTVGSLSGPTLIKWSGIWAERFGLPELSGPWFAATIFLVLALVVVNVFLRPDPMQIARQLAATQPQPTSPQPQHGRSFKEILLTEARAKLAVSAMVFGQLTMVLVMTITPVHMHGHQHELADISVVIMGHTLGMFGLSFVVGWLVDRLGRIKMITFGGLILILSCVLAPVSTETLWLALALFLLGLGWSCCFVAGSTLLADVLRAHEKGRIQGSADALVSIASGAGSLSSGLIFTAVGFLTMNGIGIVIALCPLLLIILLRITQVERPIESTV
jgi:MFS family permease